VIASYFITLIHRLNVIGQNAVDSRKFQAQFQQKRAAVLTGMLLSTSRGLTRQASSDYLNGRRLSGA
jgi:hypothetical protein